MADEEIKVFKRILWTVPNCSRLTMAQSESGSCEESEKFELVLDDNVTNWTLLLYPNGDWLEVKSFIGLFLNCVTVNSTRFTASFRLGIMGRDGENDFMGFDLQMSGELFKEVPGFGQDTLIHHDKLFDSAKHFVHGETVTFVCELTLSTTKPILRSGSGIQFNNHLYSDYQKMLGSELFADFEIHANDGVSFKAHKVVLSARSPVFYAMLTNDMQESRQNVANVLDFDSNVMREMLRFIYCNEVEGLDEISRELIYAAEKYQLEKLKEICTDNIIASLEVKNIVESLIISDRVSNTKRIYAKCVDLIISNYRDVMQTPEWIQLPKDILSKFTVEALTRLHTIRI